MSKVQEQWLNLDELSLALGQEMRLYPNPADKARYSDCQLAGYLSGEALLLTPLDGGQSLSLVEGQRVVVRVNLSMGIALFPASVMHCVDRPRLLVYLAFPPAVKFRRVRDALRVNVTLPVLASNLDHAGLSNVPGKITDLSELGTRLVTFRPLAKIGERVQLKGKFTVSGVVRTLTVQGVVRSIREGSSEPAAATAATEGADASGSSAGVNEASYGVQFLDAGDDQRLVLSNFILHAMAFGHIQVIQ